MNNKYPKEFIFKHLVITKLSNEKAIKKYLKEIEDLKEEMEYPLSQQKFMRETKEEFKKEFKKEMGKRIEEYKIEMVDYYKTKEKKYEEGVYSIRDEIKEIEKRIEEYKIENKFIKKTLSKFEIEDEI